MLLQNLELLQEKKKSREENVAKIRKLTRI